ncbi:SDR family oxidoreductase [Photobacterium lipolyticum]|uniref:Short chain dehydrogenase n=1 Tax=Photobacterium lipolyticum TaxID=266810 RepID=A0A2T3MZ12_9GAMM|nr:SDR family oxidoreductase [Photobacterium lipolyticum]PSW05140.1 short chain dehydrogenase [Photobacterium lipolyticum]
MELKAKHILLTGASGGIGSALALALAEQGANLMLVGRKEAALNDLKTSLPRPSEHQILAVDLLTTEGMSELDQTCKQWRTEGRGIDIVINNAGVNTFAFLSQRDAKSIESEVSLNVITPMLLTQKAIQWIRRPGIVLNIGSTFGAIGYPGYSVYSATKAALHRFSEAMNRELEGTEIKVLFIAPRATQTASNDIRVKDMNQALGNKTDSPEWVAQQVITTLSKEKPVTWLGWPEKIFVRINNLLPRVVSAAIRKQHATITEFVSKHS